MSGNDLLIELHCVLNQVIEPSRLANLHGDGRGVRGVVTLDLAK